LALKCQKGASQKSSHTNLNFYFEQISGGKRNDLFGFPNGWKNAKRNAQKSIDKK
jgi:hypothetical protein